MFKKLFLTLSFALLALIGAKASDHVTNNGDRYWTSFEDVSYSDGRYKHIMRASLFDSSDPNVYLTHIRCNGNGNGSLEVTDYDGDGLYYIDYKNGAYWRWDATGS